MPADFSSASDYASRVLTGDRLVLRPVEEDELSELDAWWNTPQLLPLQTSSLLPRPQGSNIDSFRSWYSNASPTAVGFGLESRSDHILLGATVLYGMSFESQTATFAIQLGPNATGHGYGPEATSLMINYGFLTLPLHRIELQVHSFNERARRCYLKSGFIEEGIRREVVYADGRWHDQILMSILRADWEESHH